jgi:uncharacterized protein YbjT (DUF2867 family)
MPDLRPLVRRPDHSRVHARTTEVVQGDCLDEASLDRALAGIHTTYDLVHSMAAGPDFARIDRRAANFARAAARSGVRRIIYLAWPVAGRRHGH